MLKEDDRNEQAAGVAGCGCVDLASPVPDPVDSQPVWDPIRYSNIEKS